MSSISACHDRIVIRGAHTLLFAEDADAARAFFRDVLGFENVDSGGGWLIFALPPAELGIHPVNRPDHVSGKQELWLMCHDLEDTVAELEAKGAEFTEAIQEESFGRYRRLTIPGAGDAWLYEPNHKSPLAEFSD
jgi:catechol 2,3-dioxygenase-like lactoylglutathione lyase family enzyme